MPMDEDGVLHVESVVLDDETAPWTAGRVRELVTALRHEDIEPTESADPREWAASAGEDQPISFTGPAGSHELTLEASGAWWWDTPYATLMQGRHTNRPEAVDQLVAAVRAIVTVATPYYACTWYGTQISPLWMRTTDAFRAGDGAAIQFFSRRYLEVHRNGDPFPDPPVTAESVAGGQLMIADRSAFGEATVAAVKDLTAYLQRHQ